ncbi:MAG: hypothetical protein KCHDKBKB_01515 [Elusimicrobia bacterium]|nr:hypothetical protein [Elusimicrobiota bacterium]
MVNGQAAEKVSFKTPDGTTLHALFVKPHSHKTTVVMHHGLASVKEEWTPLIENLEKNGMGVLAYDSRPPGTSWQKWVDDVGAAIRFLEQTKGIDRKGVALAGASVGANVCLKYAALTQGRHALLLLSPGLDYQGVQIELDLPAVKDNPLLIVAHPSDVYSFQSSQRLVSKAPHAQFLKSQKSGHGVGMFDTELLKTITMWFDKLK